MNDQDTKHITLIIEELAQMALIAGMAADLDISEELEAEVLAHLQGQV